MRLASLSGVSALLGSAALLLTGSGLQGTPLFYRAAFEGWGDRTIALLMSSHFGEFLAGAWVAPCVVRRVGHIRAFLPDGSMPVPRTTPTVFTHDPRRETEDAPAH